MPTCSRGQSVPETSDVLAPDEATTDEPGTATSFAFFAAALRMVQTRQPHMRHIGHTLYKSKVLTMSETARLSLHEVARQVGPSVRSGFDPVVSRTLMSARNM